MPYQNIINYYLKDCVKEKKTLGSCISGIDGAGISIPYHNKKNCSGVYVGMRDNLKSEILRESI